MNLILFRRKNQIACLKEGQKQKRTAFPSILHGMTHSSIQVLSQKLIVSVILFYAMHCC